MPQLAKEIQGKLARGTVGCKICHSVVRRSAPVDASQGKCLDSPYWRCPGCGLVYAAPPTLACLLEDDKVRCFSSPFDALNVDCCNLLALYAQMRNSVPELRGAGGLSLRSPLPEDTATTRRYSAAAAASPTVSASKVNAPARILLPLPCNLKVALRCRLVLQFVISRRVEACRR